MFGDPVHFGDALLLFGLPFRPVFQAHSVGGYAVPGGLTGLGLGQGRCTQELLAGDSYDVHRRHLILPSQRLPEDFIRPYLDFTQNPGKVMDDITFVRSHWWLVSEGFSLSTANSDVQKLPATLYHRIADSLAYAA